MRRLVLVFAIVVSGCSVTITGGGAGDGLSDDAGWTRSANYTTCDQWAHDMTASQRLAMVRPILPVLRRTVDSAASDGLELLPAFVAAITATCASDAVKANGGGDYVVTAAATLAFVGVTGQGSQFQP